MDHLLIGRQGQRAMALGPELCQGVYRASAASASMLPTVGCTESKYKGGMSWQGSWQLEGQLQGGSSVELLTPLL